jgi:hypothetical protein
MTTPARVNVHIGQIVVDGFAVRSRRALAAAFQRELVSLIAEAPSGFGPARAVHRVDAAADLSGDPDAAGRALARAVFGALRAGVRNG